MSFRPAFQRVAASRAGLSQFCLRRAQNETCCRANSSYRLRNEFFTRRTYATGTEQSRATAADQIFKRREEMYKQRNKTLMMYSTAVILFATGMSYAAVPLYRAFCAATGFAGTPVVGTGKFSPERLVPISDSRRIRVRFNADTSEALPWKFMPQQKYVDVLPGETSLAFYKARNTAPYDVIGIATYNVTPDRIAPYFAKVECFCFEEQKLLAGEEVDMPLLFFIDRDVLEDPACKDVDDIVLSYTFFRARRNASGQLEPDAPEDVVQASLGFDKMDSYTGRLSTESASGRSKPGFGRLSKSNRDNHNNSTSTAMVDASPQPGRPQQQHSRSSFLSFSFAKNRTNSAPSTQVHQPTLSTVREASGSNTTTTTSTAANQADEFGLSVSRPPPQQHQSAPGPGPSSSPTLQTQSGGQMATNAPAGPSGSQQGAGQQQQQQQQQPQQPAPQRQLHPEIRSIVSLSTAQAHKIYFSGPLVKHVERHTDGKIVGKEEPWREVWVQLGGTTLSVWDMKEIEEASKRGTEVPPTYLNITDASIHVLGAVTMPSPDGTPVKYSNVITLTTAGLNLLLFSCPSPQALVAWTAALRLSAYEKSRLEELYTAHLLRMSLSENGVWKDPRSPLVNGRIEGWVKIRINGQTDWKRLWMCVQGGQADGNADASMTRKHRMSALFSRASHEHSSSITSIPSPDRPGGVVGPGSAFDPRLPHIAFYASPKPRDRKKGLLTLTSVTQVFAVYPERPELISRSTLIKMEGFIGDEELAGEWRSREGWLLMMPEPDPGKLGSLEMLKWLVGLHDAFSLYGRPGGYTWNPREPISLMFAYPVGPHKDNLFLDRELAEGVDPREDRGSVVRQKFKEILVERMYGQDAAQRMSMNFSSPTGNGSAAPSSVPPSLPPIQTVVERPSEESEDHQLQDQRAPQNGVGGAAASGGGSFQLPPLSFDIDTSTASNLPPARDTSSLSPITERTDSHSLSRGSTQEQSHISPATSLSVRGATKQSTIEEEESTNVLGTQRVESPPSIHDMPSTNQQRQTSATSPPVRPAQLAPRVSQDSGAGLGSTSVSASTSISASGSGSGQGSGLGTGTVSGVTSPSRGARSPPLSPESSISRYSQPEGSIYSNQNAHITSPGQVQSPVSTSASTVQNPISDRDRDATSSSPSSFATQMQRQYQSPVSSVPPRMQQYQQQHQQQNDPVPPTPASMFSTSTHMSSPFSINELNKEQPPAPPEKNFQRMQKQNQQQHWEPQYKHKASESEYVFDEPGALYLMQQHRQAEGLQQGPSARRSEDRDERDEDEHSDNSEHSALTNPMSVRSGAPLQFAGARATPPPRVIPSPGASPSPSSPRVPVSPVPRRHAPGGFEVVSGAVGTAALANAGGGASVRSGRSGSLPDTSSYTATSPTLGGAFPGGSGAGASVGSGNGNVGTGLVENGSGSRGLGRRPSGARAPQQQPRTVGGKRFVPADSPSPLPHEADEQQPSLSPPPPPSSAQATPLLTTSPRPSQVGSPQHGRQVHSQMASSLAEDETVDALAVLSFLEQQDAPALSEPVKATSQQNEKLQQEQRSPPGTSSLPPPPTILEPEDRAPSPPSQQTSSKPYRSSFAPSKQAAERKARSAAQQAAHEEILHKPGRPNGKQRAKQREGGWESSEDEEEEEEEEEEDDDDVNTDDEAPRTASRGPPSGAPSIAAPVGRNPMVQQQMRGLSPSNSASEEFRDHQSQQRAVRTLPQIPQRGRSPGGSDRRYDQYDGPRESSMSRPQSYLPPQLQQHYQQAQQPGAARQNIWSSVLDTKTDTGMPGLNNNSGNHNRDTFLQIEAPAETMTKAFTPQGLLSAGMQDKEERSAKRQEELARESGASLINVPNKPPPPQVGLLGAITAHERERKREGGMGATLTEREREKRLAEERQRRLDELQRQQLEHQQQLAAQYGGMYGGGLSPQMTGMNPMMGGFPGYPQMMGPQSMYFNPMFPMMNPQHMFAAQQAAQAYQQAMIAMSTAGSQAGGPGGNDGNANSGDRMNQNLNPMGNSPSSGGMMGFDPRMSMMGMGGMMPMMPMGGMSPMGMQMTGGSGMGSPGGGSMGGMDPRLSLGPGAFDSWGGGAMGGPLGGGHTPGGSGQQSQRASAYNGSPRGSPAPNRGNSGNGNAQGNGNAHAEESAAKA
ncbi:hypothetical protein A7U60_g7632 [Sanghuangporus baumii]|uniref:PH domain-containing protein n=1 Tax=Sanghuangporus baumii TaxID=108892 RepID=A0A9Q5HT24_SANBA|nr:hypothetical protein A7U60_g7632 [Sanghuangporus baumii]